MKIPIKISLEETDIAITPVLKTTYTKLQKYIPVHILLFLLADFYAFIELLLYQHKLNPDYELSFSSSFYSLKEYLINFRESYYYKIFYYPNIRYLLLWACLAVIVIYLIFYHTHLVKYLDYLMMLLMVTTAFQTLMYIRQPDTALKIYLQKGGLANGIGLIFAMLMYGLSLYAIVYSCKTLRFTSGWESGPSSEKRLCTALLSPYLMTWLLLLMSTDLRDFYLDDLKNVLLLKSVRSFFRQSDTNTFAYSLLLMTILLVLVFFIKKTGKWIRYFQIFLTAEIIFLLTFGCHYYEYWQTEVAAIPVTLVIADLPLFSLLYVFCRLTLKTEKEISSAHVEIIMSEDIEAVLGPKAGKHGEERLAKNEPEAATEDTFTTNTTVDA